MDIRGTDGWMTMDTRYQKLIKAHSEPMAQVSKIKCTNAMCP